MPELMSRWEARILQRGQLALVLEELAQQCGTLPEAVLSPVRDLSPEQLGDLGRALLRFSQLSDLTTWLATHAPAAH